MILFIISVWCIKAIKCGLCTDMLSVFFFVHPIFLFSLFNPLTYREYFFRIGRRPGHCYFMNVARDSWMRQDKFSRRHHRRHYERMWNNWTQYIYIYNRHLMSDWTRVAQILRTECSIFFFFFLYFCFLLPERTTICHRLGTCTNYLT